MALRLLWCAIVPRYFKIYFGRRSLQLCQYQRCNSIWSCNALVASNFATLCDHKI